MRETFLDVAVAKKNRLISWLWMSSWSLLCHFHGIEQKERSSLLANFTPYHETLWSETKGKSILVLATLLKNVVSHDSSHSMYNRGKKSDIPWRHSMTNFILSNWLNYTLIAFRGKPYKQTWCVPFEEQYNKKALFYWWFSNFSLSLHLDAIFV